MNIRENDTKHSRIFTENALANKQQFIHNTTNTRQAHGNGTQRKRRRNENPKKVMTTIMHEIKPAFPLLKRRTTINLDE
uniref:Uncharacterized protein n=1 Tax=Rhizophora mucronata TaxID=61149 RepID=A0A2P2QHG1_RHIMU